MFVEIAQGSPFNRGLLIAKNDLVKYINSKDPLYRSMYLYNEDAKKYADENNTIKRYIGERAIDKILIDIDKEKNTNEFTQQKAQAAIMHLEELGVDSESIQPFFSGTGYHLVLPNSVFNFSPSDDLPYVVKYTMEYLFQDIGIDSSVYMRTGIYRVQHTKNQKTGLYKIPITMREIMSSSPDEILKLAETPRLEFPYTEMIGDGELEEHIVTEIPSIRSEKKVTEPSNIVPCIQSMINLGPQEGNRHHTAMRIISHFRRNGFPSNFVKAAMMHWNDNNLEQSEIERLVEDTYNGGYCYSCQDKLMVKHCKPRCVFFKRKDYLIEVKGAEELQGELHERLTTDFSGRCVDLSGMLGLSVDSKIYPGELVTIFGPTGCNKTTFAQNLVLGLDFVKNEIDKKYQIPTLFLSLELSDWYMHKRHLQIVSDTDKDTVNDNYSGIYEKHGHQLQHLSIQTVSPTLEQIKGKIRELQPAVVIVDYIDLVATPSNIRSEYEQIKYISHSLSNMAVNMDIIIIQISQVARDYSRNEVLDLYAGKGSGAIENASRKVIGLKGQANSKNKTVQMFKNTDGELFSCELEWTPSFRMRRTDI
tara:strand:+ start:5765 stop:7534 length:1770 start_codon:yes stop_codon:yes gene_type:complete